MKTPRPIAVVALAAILAGAPAIAGDWPALSRDGIHDPAGPSINLLQEPREALSRLPPDSSGNQVNWVEALESSHISPRSNLLPGGNPPRLLETDILLNLRGGTPIVRFPHRQHTQWLDCSGCHERIFVSRAGANKMSMLQILQGEQCGTCHGAVAFPLTECSRCHSVPRASPAQGKAP